MIYRGPVYGDNHSQRIITLGFWGYLNLGDSLVYNYLLKVLEHSMPGYRRYARKKVIRRKRSYKKKMMYRRRPRADLGHLEKIVRCHPLTVDATGLFAIHDVDWIATGASG